MSVRKKPRTTFVKGLDDEEKDRQFIGSLSRGLEILRAFEASRGPLTNQDLVACTDLPKSTISRITRTLTIEGMLTYLPAEGAYRLAPVVLGLARAFHDSTGIAEIARSHMQELADAIRGTVALAARDRLDMVYMAICRGISNVRVPQAPGSRIPISSSAIGNAYYHGVDAEERSVLTELIKRKTQRSWPLVEQELERAGRDMAQHGFCVSLGVWNPDINGVGVPLRLPDGTVVAFNVGGPAFWLKEDKLYDEIGPRLLAMTRNVLADMTRKSGLDR